VVVPPNTTATVRVPGAKVGDVKEGGGPAVKARGVGSFQNVEDGSEFDVGSGSYQFSAPYGR
jgi:alpha-L-rhamnosidase